MSSQNLKNHFIEAAGLVFFSISAANSQGLGQRLTQAEQKLDSDFQNCRSIDVDEFGSLLKEAVANKLRADKMGRQGVPVDQAKVDADLATALSIFNRANAMMVQQCILNATQQQAQPQTTPQTTTTTPGGLPASAPGLSPNELSLITLQQELIENVEKALEELRTEVRDGSCEETWVKVRILDDFFNSLDGLDPDQFELNETELKSGFLWRLLLKQQIPPRTIEKWNRQIDEMLEQCPDAGPQKSKVDVSEILDAHNVERARFGYDPLRWSFKLADNAQYYSDKLGETGELSHASRQGRGTERENLSQGLPGWSTRQLIATWFDERKFFKAGVFPDVSITGNWFHVGHYSQAIWPQTTAIGCGMATGNGFSWLVCRYDPGGNKDGKPVGFIATPRIN